MQNCYLWFLVSLNISIAVFGDFYIWEEYNLTEFDVRILTMNMQMLCPYWTFSQLWDKIVVMLQSDHE